MVSPCPKCEAVRAEPARGSIFYRPFKLFGYRLTECARCGRWRVFPTKKKTHHDPENARKLQTEAAVRMVEEKPAPEVVTAKNPRSPKGACPVCGSHNFHRSKRSFWERMTARPPMVRCGKCRERFPRPLKGSKPA
jgi:hypothetical protein